MDWLTDLLIRYPLTPVKGFLLWVALVMGMIFLSEWWEKKKAIKELPTVEHKRKAWTRVDAVAQK